MLHVSDVMAGYGKKIVLYEISLVVNPREIVALIGPNGAGKSTALKAIFGLLRIQKGQVFFQGMEIENRKPSLNVRAGLNFVPQGNRVFTEMTVLENLQVGGYILKDQKDLRTRVEKILELFPILKDRKDLVAGKLSGGEKQMLALGRALILKPHLLLLDEPSLGLSTQLSKIAIKTIKEINDKLNTSILIVEQNVPEALSIAHRVYLLKLGRVVLEDTPMNLSKQDRIQNVFLM